MYFPFENGYDPSDLVVQFRQEKKVAKEIGLSQRSHFLSLMENLVCHFYEIRNVESTPSMRQGMSTELIKTKMSSEAESILNNLNDRNQPNPPQRQNRRLRRKLYKYPCSICKKEYNNLSNHWKHAHKLSKKEVEQLKSGKNQGKAKQSQEKNKNKRPIRCCPLRGCTWVGRRFDYHLPKVHNIDKDSEKYSSLVHNSG